VKTLSSLIRLLLLSTATLAHSYEFPISDRFAATVVGTPPPFQAQLPRQIPVQEYRLEGLREAPPLLWHQQGLRFSAALQGHKAPLVFNIAGTGAAFNASKMQLVQKALYQAGFHVINLSSPTHINFQVNASLSMLPGLPNEDAEDLYRVMSKAYDEIKDDIEVSAFHITGYSLGGLHAAFIAHLDRQQQRFNLQRVLMINPPVNLYNSVKLLDQMLVDNIEGGIDGVGNFLNRAIETLAVSYRPDEGMRFDSDFLYRAYQELPEQNLHAKGRSGAAALIAFAFRLSSGAMVFTGDVMTQSGYIVPKNKQFNRREPVGYYAQASHRVQFHEYVDDMIIPYALKRYPGKNREQLIAEASLNHIAGFVRNNPDIYAITNRDEIILAPGELDYLSSLLGERIQIYPAGGHCGNMAHRDNVQHMIAVLRGDHG
jgi:hypothetical protein